MLNVNLYHNFESFCLEQSDNIQETIYICPGPLIADKVRSILSNNAEVLTIAKWVNDQLKVKQQKRIMKSELLLRLSSVWRHYFPQTKEQIFFRSFEIFTDFRSFTLEKNLLEEVLQELDPEIKRSVLLFWVYFETENLIDEQLAYKIVSGNSVARSLCFVGFKHMNAVQIDMLKSMAEFASITVAFPKEVYKESNSNDWIQWLLPKAENRVGTLNNCENVVQVIAFQKNKLNHYLQAFRKINSEFDIVIPAPSLEINQFQEVLDSTQFFKSSLDIFACEQEKIFTELKKQDFTITFLKEWVSNKKQNEIKDENYRALKICTMIDESLSVFQELTEKLDSFYITVLNQVVALNLPRNYIVNISQDSKMKILDLEEHRFESINTKVLIIASSLYGKLSAKDKPYNEKIVEVLSTIGPLKRAGLDFLFAKDTLHNLLSHKDSVLFLEEGLLDSDLAWREVLKKNQVKYLQLPLEYISKEKRDVIKETTNFKMQNSDHLSVSKLQSFLDCPRKYYFSYIDKLVVRPTQRLSIDPDEKGNLEHKIIEEYFILNEGYDFESHYRVCKQIFKKFLDVGEIILSKQLEEETFYELLEYTKNGIVSLVTYKKQFPGATLQFEIPLGAVDFNMKGYIDCILLDGNKAHIFDFKRSATSIGSKKDLLRFDKIQLWIYRWAMLEKYQVVWWGYINLSEGILSGLSSEDLAEDHNFDLYLKTIVEKFRIEAEFAPIPRDEKVCNYCELKLICPKEKVS